MNSARRERVCKLGVLAEEASQPEINSSDENAEDDHNRQYLPAPDPPRLRSEYCNAWREHGLERFVIQLAIVHRHFARVIKLGAVHNDCRLQFCSQSRPGMKHGRLAHSAIIRRPNIDRHLVSTSVFAAVELDLGFELPAHLKGENQTSNCILPQLFFLKF
jgi:hypothetical protein